MLFISEGNSLSGTFILIVFEGFYVSEQIKPIEIKSTSKIIYPW